jgi:putative SOS response-associated peptidase YedK
MISRYALYDTAKLTDHFHLTQGLPKGVKPSYNISPTASAPVIITSEGTRVLRLMKWGLVAKGAKDTNSVFRYKTYDTPLESVFSRHSSEQAIRERRCLIPANGFYELSRSGEKRAFYAHPNDKTLLAFAGVYSSWQDPEGTVHGTFSILTTKANDDMPDPSMRMPVIIRPEDEKRWLDPTATRTNDFYSALQPYAADQLTVYEVSPDVHSPKLNQPRLIERVER